MQFCLPLQVDGVKSNMLYNFSSATLVLSLGLHTYIYTDTCLAFSLSTQEIVSLGHTSKYVCGLCGKFSSDAADDLHS